MRKITVLSMISLDGVLQAPGTPWEDTSGGFRFGGWSRPYADEIYNETVKEELQQADYLLGRKTFEIWEGYWPQRAELWPGINEGTKYVMSNTRTETKWENSIFIKGLADINELKDTDGPDVQVWGSGELIQLLLRNDLVDELRLKIHPLSLGDGKKLFENGSIPVSFQLLESSVTSTGVIIAHYKRDGEVKTGS